MDWRTVGMDQPHNATFYKLMDEILDLEQEHAALVARGIVADSGGFPMHREQACVLGGSANKGSSAATATEARSQQKSSPWMPQEGPQKLGGDGAVTKWMKPGEAAAAASAERCLADGKWCLPCTTVVELLAIE